jgi:hypothetical protein
MNFICALLASSLALGSEDFQVRQQTATCLAFVRLYVNIDPVLVRLTKHEDGEVRKQAADLLASPLPRLKDVSPGRPRRVQSFAWARIDGPGGPEFKKIPAGMKTEWVPTWRRRLAEKLWPGGDTDAQQLRFLLWLQLFLGKE